MEAAQLRQPLETTATNGNVHCHKSPADPTGSEAQTSGTDAVNEDCQQGICVLVSVSVPGTVGGYYGMGRTKNMGVR